MEPISMVDKRSECPNDLPMNKAKGDARIKECRLKPVLPWGASSKASEMLCALK